MKRIKKWICEKVKGSSEYIATLVSMSMLLILVVGSIYVYGEVVKRNEVERIHRKYLLEMEREGYLSPINRGALINDLEALGCTDVSVTGSLAPVGYGNTITLRIECDLEVLQINIDVDGSSTERGTRHVIIEKAGTALY